MKTQNIHEAYKKSNNSHNNTGKKNKTAGCRSQFQSKQSELENIGIKDAKQ